MLLPLASPTLTPSKEDLDENPNIILPDDAWEFYKKKIYPFKGKIELWYQKRMGFLLDFKLIILTAWVILFPKSKIYEKLFKDLPKRNF